MASSVRSCPCSPLPTTLLGGSSQANSPSVAFLYRPRSIKNAGFSMSVHARSSGESTRPAFTTRAASAEVSTPSASEADSRVVQVHSREEFDALLQNAKKKLVVAEFAASHSKNSARIYPSLVELSRTTPDAEFLLVMGDESEEMSKLCKDEGVQNVPHFVFYKDGVKVHEEEGISPDQLYSDVLYYGDSETPVKQLHSKEEFLGLIKDHMEDHKLVVIDMTLNNCGPCAKVYPTVVNLSHQMENNVVFARMIGNENDSCKEMMKAFKVVEVPTFLFIRDGKLSGRYVGSGRGELIGEILRYQGVKCT